jgi:hypothetical protein
VVDGGRSVERVLLPLVQQVLGDRVQAAAYATDPWGYLAAEGVTDRRLAGAEVVRLVRRACGTVRLAPRITSHAAAGGRPHLPLPADRLVDRPPSEQLVQILHHLLRVSYDGDHYVTTLLARHVPPPSRAADHPPTLGDLRDQSLRAGTR